MEDADPAQGVIRVRHSLKITGRELARDDLKTSASRRTLVMPAAVRRVLAALRERQEADRLLAGEHYADCGLVLTDAAGRPLRPPYVTRSFQKLCRDAGLGTDWQPRELRHTFVSLLSSAGVPIEDVADAAGHASSNVTRTVYRHQLADVIAGAATAMDTIFATDVAS